jgi:hypothetical protein
MKKSILVVSILSTFSAYASYVVVVDKEESNYDHAGLIEEIEYTEWVDTGILSNCRNESPLDSDIYEGTSFTQNVDCDEKQERTKTKTSEETEEQTKVTASTQQSVGTYEAISCLDILNHGGSNIDGNYQIKPNQTKITAFCDMINGGYTTITRSSSSSKFTAEVEADCQSENMKLFIPRTEQHLEKAVKTLSASYFKLMGIYPNQEGTSCATVYFNSDTCHNFAPKDGGKWFVYNWDMSYPHNGGGFGVYPEPNGDNSLNSSLSYTFDSATGRVTAFNDIRDSSTSSPGGYKTTSWACSAIGEESI